MDHFFFIWCAYGAAAIILGWTAISPVISHRRAIREQQANSGAGNQHDANA